MPHLSLVTSTMIPQRATVPIDGRPVPVPEALQAAARWQGNGELDRAETVYRAILSLEPDQPDALHLLGVVMLQRHHPDAAVDLISRAIARQSGIAMYHNNLGKAYRAGERFVEALSQFQRAHELDPGMVEAVYNSGETLRWLNRAEEAIQMFERVVGMRPAYSVAYVRKGEILQKLGRIEEALGCYRQAIASGPDKAGVYFEVGCALAALGKRDEAIKHYEQAIVLRPAMVAAHLELADLHKQDGRLREAAECCRRALAFQPDNVFSRHMLNAIENAPIECAPAEYVRQLFDDYSARFDQALVKNLQYQAPILLTSALRCHFSENSEDLDALDLGCGTGLVGVEMQNICGHLTGIDLSTKMLQKARERGIYDELLEGDVVDCMARLESGSFDIVVAADVFIYIGNLMPVFEQCRRLLRPGGVFAFSAETLPDNTADYALGVTQRFRHSCGYIEKLCPHFGFIEVHRELNYIRKQNQQPVAGCYYLLKRE